MDSNEQTPNGWRLGFKIRQFFTMIILISYINFRFSLLVLELLSLRDRGRTDFPLSDFSQNLIETYKLDVNATFQIALTQWVFELSGSQTEIIPKQCFSDSLRSKKYRFFKIWNSNILTITTFYLCFIYEKVRKKKHWVITVNWWI